ncbi:hypothetical protein [Streptomyces sp. BP-8]|uniref:DNA-binding response regulator n=1 Tax=Streptomyces sirii TaxID=3127701 RepID=A0ABZ2QXC2_9ACTN
MPSVNVVVVDGHQLMRDDLQNILESGDDIRVSAYPRIRDK